MGKPKHGYSQGEQIAKCEPKDIDEAYRYLASEIIKKAAQDYTHYLLHPDFDEQVFGALDIYKRSRAVDAVIQDEEHPMTDGDREEAWQVLSALINEAKNSGLFAETNGGRWKAIMASMRNGTAKKKLELTSHRFRLCCMRTYSGWVQKSNRRRREKAECEEFFHSDRFALYTGDILDPETLIAECKRRAALGEEFVGDYED